MANRKFAVVQKDPVETNSTGGIVVSLKNWPENASDRTRTVFELPNEFGTGHTFELIPCGDDVQIGWIYTDKTNIFVDSNVSSN
tara:strand:- start:4515 stop:4766 length:252 start_codon:yes stop_codon:yes gene_type:complete